MTEKKELSGCPIPGCIGKADTSGSFDGDGVKCDECGFPSTDHDGYMSIEQWEALATMSEELFGVREECKEWKWAAYPAQGGDPSTVTPAVLREYFIKPSSESVLELAALISRKADEMQAMGAGAVDCDDFRRFASQLESVAPGETLCFNGCGAPARICDECFDTLRAPQPKAAPGMGTPGEVIGEVGCPGCGAVLQVDHGEDPGELGALLIPPLPVHGTPQPKAEAGECCICSSVPAATVCTECLDLAINASPDHLRTLERDADVLCTIRHRMGAADNDALLDMVEGPQPKAEAGSVWVGLSVPSLEMSPDKVVVESTAAEAAAESDKPFHIYGPFSIGAPSKGECRDGIDTEHCGLVKVQAERAMKADARAETAERDLRLEQTKVRDLSVKVSNLREQKGTALAGEAKARTARDKHQQLYREVIADRDELDRQLNRATVELLKRGKDIRTLREQLGEAERTLVQANANNEPLAKRIEEYIDGENTLRARVAELEEMQHCHGCGASPGADVDFYCTGCVDPPSTPAEQESEGDATWFFTGEGHAASLHDGRILFVEPSTDGLYTWAVGKVEHFGSCDGYKAARLAAEAPPGETLPENKTIIFYECNDCTHFNRSTGRCGAHGGHPDSRQSVEDCEQFELLLSGPDDECDDHTCLDLTDPSCEKPESFQSSVALKRVRILLKRQPRPIEQADVRNAIGWVCDAVEALEKDKGKLDAGWTGLIGRMNDRISKLEKEEGK